MKITFRELQNLIVIFNKLYRSEGLAADIKIVTLRFIEKAREEESKFRIVKDELVEKYVQRDDEGKPVTAQTVINGISSEVFVFGENEAAYQEDIDPLMNAEVELDKTILNMSLESVCKTILSPRDIDILKTRGFINEIKEDKKNVTRKQIIIPGQPTNIKRFKK